MLEERKEKRKRTGCQLFLKIRIFIFISQHTFLLIVLLGASWNCIHLPWVYCYTVGINFNLKKADWCLFTYFTEPLCLQLKIFLSCSVWDDEAWAFIKCIAGEGQHGVGPTACLIANWQSPLLVYFCYCVTAAFLLMQSGLCTDTECSQDVPWEKPLKGKFRTIVVY